MLKEIQDLFIEDIVAKRTELNELKYNYIQFLMAFIPDVDLVNLYEEHNDLFGALSGMTKEEILQLSGIINHAIFVLECWIKNNYNVPFSFTNL